MTDHTHFVKPGSDRSHQPPKPACKVVCFNGEKITALRAALPRSAALASAAARHKVLGHPARLAVLAVLAVDECCVCDLANVLRLPLSTLSQHLRTLREAGLVRSRQEGKLVFYSLSEGARTAASGILALEGVA